MAEPNYGGAYVNKVSQEEIDKAFEDAAMKPSAHHPAPGKYVPLIADVLREAAKEAEPEEEARFGGESPSSTHALAPASIHPVTVARVARLLAEHRRPTRPRPARRSIRDQGYELGRPQTDHRQKATGTIDDGHGRVDTARDSG